MGAGGTINTILVYYTNYEILLNYYILYYCTLYSTNAASDVWLQAPPHPAHKVIARLANQPCLKAFNAWFGQYEAWVFARRSMAHFTNAGLSLGVRMWVEYAELQVQNSTFILHYSTTVQYHTTLRIPTFPWLQDTTRSLYNTTQLNTLLLTTLLTPPSPSPLSEGYEGDSPQYISFYHTRLHVTSYLHS